MSDSGDSSTCGLSSAWSLPAREQRVCVPAPVNLPEEEKPRTASPISTKAVFRCISIFLLHLCFDPENKSSSKLKKEKVDNNRAKNIYSIACGRHPLNGKRKLCVKCGGTNCLLVKHENARSLGGAAAGRAAHRQPGELGAHRPPGPWVSCLPLMLAWFPRQWQAGS